MTFLQLFQALCAFVVACGSLHGLLCAAAGANFRVRRKKIVGDAYLPPVSILKPLHGVDKALLANLRSACRQDYPEYQVVLSVQRFDDPAIPVMRQIQQEFGEDRVALAVAERGTGNNGKIQNLEIAVLSARHDVLVISDSDIRLRPDYLRAVTAPLRDPSVGFVCTPYRAIDARRWFEKLELLTMNADFVPNLFLVSAAGLLSFGLGASMCFRRRDLEAIGGFSAFRDVLAEDAYMAERFRALGLRMALVPHIVDMEVDLDSFGQWWSHQVYWDQNTRVIQPMGYFATVIVRAVPFALFFALLRSFDATALAVLGAAIGIRLASAGYVLGRVLDDREGLAALWLLPLRDLLGLIVWLAVMIKRDFVRRGRRYHLLPGGRIISKPVR